MEFNPMYFFKYLITSSNPASSPINPSIMTFGLENGVLLKELFSKLANILSNIRLIVTPSKIYLSHMDSSHIILVIMILEPSDFDTYQCENTYELGIDLDALNKILKRVQAKNGVLITHDPKEASLKVIITEKGEDNRVFTYRLYTDANESIEANEILQDTQSTHFTIPIGLLSNIIEDAHVFSEVVSIESSLEGIRFNSVGADGEYNFFHKKSRISSFRYLCKGDGAFYIVLTQNLVKFKELVKKSKSTPEVLISFGINTPLSMKIELFNKSRLYLVQAPRVDDDIEDEGMSVKRNVLPSLSLTDIVAQIQPIPYPPKLMTSTRGSRDKITREIIFIPLFKAKRIIYLIVEIQDNGYRTNRIEWLGDKELSAESRLFGDRKEEIEKLFHWINEQQTNAVVFYS